MDEIFEKINIKNYKRIAIMGGTFDPIHLGHLYIAETVREELDIDKVIFIPSGSPPHKNNRCFFNPYQRMTMVKMAIESNEYFEASKIEIERNGNSYTIDTLNEFKQNVDKDIDLYFIIGADSLLEIHTWKESSKLLQTYKFVVVSRPGYKSSDVNKKISELKKRYKAVVIEVNVPGFYISSSQIREKILQGKSIKYMVPENIEQYIYNSNIFK